MHKNELAHTLESIAAHLQLTGDDNQRVHAFQMGAKSVAEYRGALEEAVSTGALDDLKGITSPVAEVVRELLETGKSSSLETLQNQVPPGLIEMLKVPGLGTSKVRLIHRELHIDSLGELELAAREGRLDALPRFGPRTSAKLLRQLESMRQDGEKRLLHHATQEATYLLRSLREPEGVVRAEIAGAVRRRVELIGKFDFAVSLRDPSDSFLTHLRHTPGFADVAPREPGVLGLRTGNGSLVDIYYGDPEQFGYVWLRATGSAKHVTALARECARVGVAWTSQGPARDGTPLRVPREADVYALSGLPYIEPELREDSDAIETARRGKLPTLIELRDIRGFIHCHSTYSDGASTVREWAEACHAAGYEYLGVTDHSEHTYGGGFLEAQIAAQHKEIDAVNAAQSRFRVLKGVEADILPDGSLDYDVRVRSSFDFIIGSVHNQYGMSEGEMTDRVLTAMDDPHMAILGHPTGRLLLTRNPYPLDLDAIFTKAAAVGVAIEINADPQRLDLDWRRAREAAARGVMITIGADAHGVTNMGNMEIGVGMARKAWLTRDRVLNTQPVDAFLKVARHRRNDV